jgi:hypothetical protein
MREIGIGKESEGSNCGLNSFAAKLATMQGAQAASFHGTRILVRSNFVALQL